MLFDAKWVFGGGKSKKGGGVISRSNKRQDIIDGAIALLAEQGADSFSAANLAQAAGVSKANLYHHFDSLDDILIESFEQFSLGLGMWAPPDGISFRDWLEATGQELFGMSGTDGDLMNAYCVFATKALFDPNLRQRFAKTYVTARAALCDVVSQIYPESLEWGEVEALADLIMITLDGMGMHAKLFPERSSAVARAWAEFIDRIAPQTA